MHIGSVHTHSLYHASYDNRDEVLGVAQLEAHSDADEQVPYKINNILAITASRMQRKAKGWYYDA